MHCTCSSCLNSPQPRSQGLSSYRSMRDPGNEVVQPTGFLIVIVIICKRYSKKKMDSDILTP